jgi:hypothetical protein
MRFIINLSVVFLALVIGAAAVPRTAEGGADVLIETGPSHCFFFFFIPCAILTTTFIGVYHK